jgi:hypothetical protein
VSLGEPLVVWDGVMVPVGDMLGVAEEVADQDAVDVVEGEAPVDSDAVGVTLGEVLADTLAVEVVDGVADGIGGVEGVCVGKTDGVKEADGEVVEVEEVLGGLDDA